METYGMLITMMNEWKILIMILLPNLELYNCDQNQIMIKVDDDVCKTVQNILWSTAEFVRMKEKYYRHLEESGQNMCSKYPLQGWDISYLARKGQETIGTLESF